MNKVESGFGDGPGDFAEVASASGRRVKILAEGGAIDEVLLRYSAEVAGVDLEYVDAATLEEARHSLVSEDFDIMVLDGYGQGGPGSAAARPATETPIGETPREQECVDFIRAQKLSAAELARVVRAIATVDRGETPAQSFEAYVCALGERADIGRMKTVVSEMIGTVSTVREHVCNGRQASALSSLEELSELAFLLWPHVSGGESKGTDWSDRRTA